LIRAPLSVSSVLDEAAETMAATAWPWAFLLAAATFPYRFVQAVFFDQLLEVGADAARYGNLLGATANLVVGTLLLSLAGRAVYARACGLAASGGVAGLAALRVSPVAFASYVLTASAAVLVGYVTLFTIFGFAVAVMLSGIALGTMELNERVSLFGPFRLIFRHTRRVAIPVALCFVCFCALFVALANVSMAFSLGVWLARAFGGFDAPHWPILFGVANRRFILMLFVSAILLVEPFWIAANVVYVRKAGAEERGEDLRAWFHELRRSW
jgi:hypothetical protein